MMQLRTDLHRQVCFRGAVFTMVEGGVVEFFKSLGESLEPQQFELYEFIAQGNKVVVLGYQKGYAKPTE